MTLQELRDAMKPVLGFRERELLVLSRGRADEFTYTLDECGRIFKITKQRVSQINKSSIEKLRAKRSLDILVEIGESP